MNNKFLHNYSFIRNKKNHKNILLSQLTNQSNLYVSSLSYSKSPETHIFIPLSQLPEKDQVYPQIAQFEQTHEHKELKKCKRKNFLDRRFQAIKKLNKSAPNVKIMSPKKVDIVLQQQKNMLKTKKVISIHSVKKFSPSNKINSQRDLLKEFKQLQYLRKQLRSRKYQQTKTIHLGVNNQKKNLFLDKSQTFNPQKSNLYVQVKNRISKRYNNMFRKYADSAKQGRIKDQQFLKGFFSARGVDRKKVEQTS